MHALRVVASGQTLILPAVTERAARYLRGEGMAGAWEVATRERGGLKRARATWRFQGVGAAASVVPQFETAPTRLNYPEADSPWFVRLGGF